MTGGYRLDPGSRLALYERVVQTLERSADLAERHAEREQRDGRSNEAAYEWERARRARQLVARARAILRMTAELASSSAGSVSHAPWLTAPTVRVSPDRMSVSAVAEHACGGTVDNHSAGELPMGRTGAAVTVPGSGRALVRVARPQIRDDEYVVGVAHAHDRLDKRSLSGGRMIDRARVRCRTSRSVCPQPSCGQRARFARAVQHRQTPAQNPIPAGAARTRRRFATPTPGRPSTPRQPERRGGCDQVRHPGAQRCPFAAPALPAVRVEHQAEGALAGGRALPMLPGARPPPGQADRLGTGHQPLQPARDREQRRPPALPRQTGAARDEQRATQPPRRPRIRDGTRVGKMGAIGPRALPARASPRAMTSRSPRPATSRSTAVGSMSEARRRRSRPASSRDPWS